MAWSLPYWGLWDDALPGGGHPVLVLPGLMTDDRGTQPLRQVLERLQFAPYGWDQGLNRGEQPGLWDALDERLDRLVQKHGQAVSLVGWSLGGALAYALAARHPDRVRRLITLSAPLGGQSQATHAGATYQLATGHTHPQRDLEALLRDVPACPITAITTREDGVIAWPAALVAHGPNRENLLVKSTHWGLPANPQAIWVVAQRLAEAGSPWRPYDPERDDTGWLPSTERLHPAS